MYWYSEVYPKYLIPVKDGQHLGFKDFESARRTLTGIEIVHMIKKNQLNNQEQSMFKSFSALAA
jgi:transposase-like protein